MAPSSPRSCEDPSALVRFRDGARAGSIVLLPGLGPDISGVTQLADRLGGRGAIYILDFNHLADGLGEPLSVEDLAARALALVSAAGGVDTCVGYSFGGLVALEMARLSGAGGRAPIKAILIDTAFEQSYWPRRVWLMSMWLRMLQYGRGFIGMPAREAAAELRRRVRGAIARIRQRSAGRACGRISLAAAGAAGTPAMRTLSQAYLDYRPVPVKGPLTLLECSDPSYATPVSVVWRPLAPNLRVVKYAGRHTDVVHSEAGAEVLAAQLNACLGVAS